MAKISKQKKYLAVINLILIVSLAACSGGGSDSTAGDAVTVKLIALNDFHGRLKVDPSDSGAKVTVLDSTSTTGVTSLYAGGAAFLATLVKQLKATNEYSMVVGAGDFIGASQPIAGLTSEEAAIDVMSQIGLEVTSVGNHEFDKGKAELLRMQNGGCKAAASGGIVGQTTCISNSTFLGAKFQYLAANMVDSASKLPLLPGTYIKQLGPVTIGFIGLPLQGTPTATSGANDLTFSDEVSVINAKAQELKGKGVDAVVVLIHQGGQTQASYINDQSCPGFTGLIGPIVSQLINVDVVVSGHTHQEYICRDAKTGILMTSAGLYGRMVTDIDLKIIPGKGVVEKSAKTLPVLNNLNNTVPPGYTILAADPATQGIIDTYNTATVGTLSEIQGYTSQKLSNCQRTQTFETPLGDVVADAYLDSYNRNGSPSTPGHIAFTNVGGLRSNIDYVNGGAVTYDALYTVAPFGNSLVYKAMTGAQIKRLLEQQWEATNCAEKQLANTTPTICGRLLQPSSTLRYTWDYSRGQNKPVGQGNLLISVEIYDSNAWQQIIDTNTYGVITNGFLAGGGDKFDVFQQQTNDIDFGKTDLMALEDYFGNYPNASNKLPAPTARATCVNCPTIAPADLALCQ